MDPKFLKAEELGIRLEVVSGLPIWEAHPVWRHQKAIDRIRQAIKPRASADVACMHASNVYVQFADGSLKRPDIAIFCREPSEQDDAIQLVPEAVIEVVSRGYEAKDLEIGPPLSCPGGQGRSRLRSNHPARASRTAREDDTRNISSVDQPGVRLRRRCVSATTGTNVASGAELGRREQASRRLAGAGIGQIGTNFRETNAPHEGAGPWSPSASVRAAGSVHPSSPVLGAMQLAESKRTVGLPTSPSRCVWSRADSAAPIGCSSPWTSTPPLTAATNRTRDTALMLASHRMPEWSRHKWIGVARGKFFDWKKRYGKVNEHNAAIPRDHWLEPWEREAIVRYFETHPLEGYRRLSFMMLDADVVAVSPATV